MTKRFLLPVATMLGFLLVPVQSSAATITCPETLTTPPEYRQVTLGPSATVCTWINGTEGTTDAGEVLAFQPGDPWDSVGSVTGAGTFGSHLTVALTSGSWGAAPAAGTWAISSAFWMAYSEAVISFHVGNGPPDFDPDKFLFAITPGSLSGTWSYDVLAANKGGGLSNVFLWGRGDGLEECDPAVCDPQLTLVPEPATLTLLGLGLLGAGAAGRRRNRKQAA